MKSVVLSLVFSLIWFPAHALQVVKSGQHQAQLQAPAIIDFTIVQISAACVFTYDPQWAEEEDTGAARLVFESADDAKEYDSLIKTQGLKAYGLGGTESCGYRNGRPDSTFPRVKTADGKDYFSQYLPVRTLVDAARQQKAFKKVPLVLAKGFEELRTDLAKVLTTFEQDVLKDIKKQN